MFILPTGNSKPVNLISVIIKRNITRRSKEHFLKKQNKSALSWQMVLDLSGGHPAWKLRLIAVWPCMLSCIFGKESRFLFSQMETLLQVNICSVSAWFPNNIDLLMRNTQLLEKPECAIIIQRASGHYCMSVWPWQWSVLGLVPWWILFSRVEERDTNTEPEVPSNAGLRSCYSTAAINAGTATGALYHTVQWMTTVESCFIMRGGSGGDAALGECWTGRWIKKGNQTKFWRLNERMRARKRKHFCLKQQWDIFISQCPKSNWNHI